MTGDTVWYEGIAEIARRFSPRLVIVFAGSAKPRGPFHVTMDNNDAIETAHAFPDARIVAIHNHGWTHFTESPADVVKAFGAWVWLRVSTWNWDSPSRAGWAMESISKR